jgi:hypothetical protein
MIVSLPLWPLWLRSSVVSVLFSLTAKMSAQHSNSVFSFFSAASRSRACTPVGTLALASHYSFELTGNLLITIFSVSNPILSNLIIYFL